MNTETSTTRAAATGDGLAGRVAIVTGGAGGLGQAIVHRLADAGARVVVTGRGNDDLEAFAEEVAEHGGEAMPLECDQRDPAAVAAAVAEITDTWGRLDVLVNNAATYTSRAWHELSVEEWDQQLEVNLRGSWLWAREARPQLETSPAGRIINIVSNTFHYGWTELLGYVSSKGGLIGFTRALARELGPTGVTVNAIAPGAFPTAAEEVHPDREAFERQLLERQSIKRRGRPEEVGDLVTFLAGDRAGFMTGQTLVLDGGWMLH